MLCFPFLIFGYKAVGVPGEIHGYWTAFKRYGSGRVAWQDLLMPTVHLLNNGYPVSKLMKVTLESVRGQILTEDGQSMRFFYRNETGEDSFVQEGELLKNPQLGETYRKLAVSSDPVRLFYGGELAKQIDEEFQKYEGYITKKDLEAYRSIIDEKPLYNDHFDEDYAMCGSKPTSGFAVTQLIVSLVSKFYPRGSNQNVLFTSDDYFHKLIESQKFAYALRTRLGDPNFVQEAGELAEKMTQKDFIEKIVEKIKDEALPLEDYGPEFGQPKDMGTSHVSIVNENLAISLTSSINNRFGSLRRSERLGIIWNNHMDDFSVPGAKNFYGFDPSKDNFIQPGKRPLSSMSPLVIFNKHTKEIKAAIGASGGSKIISATAQVILNVLNFNLTVKEAIDFPRIHNQFTPIRTEFENGFPEVMVEALQNRGHNMTDMTFPITFVQAVFRDSTGALTANNDYRRMVYMYPTGY
uniref:Gamma-glutamyltranspeptidase 1 n=1 Tax=Acrobeloides nanus TaxID=290746 RepID=A0A914CF41_9BILA